MYNFASVKWKAKCTLVLGDATKRIRCRAAAVKVMRPVLTVKTMRVSIMLSDFLMPVRDWSLEPSSSVYTRGKTTTYLVEIVAKKAGNCTVEDHIGNTPHDKDRGMLCVGNVRACYKKKVNRLHTVEVRVELFTSPVDSEEHRAT